jgi:type 1 glutamine amidotransferase
MQDREGWLKPAGTGWIVYLQMGHTTAEFENAAVAQMVLNAVNWKPGAR